jgi:hypothetical protein
MHMDTIDLKVLPDGRVIFPYDDKAVSLLEEAGISVKRVERASNIEWESQGWTVRAAHDRELAVRWEPPREPPEGVEESRLGRVPTRCVSKEGPIIYFKTREGALEVEKQLFWQLIPEDL